ncbi:MAG: TetR/AcrR family transcriptional regulator [Parvibaculum sp.]|nr:TetR/AcrR family transcriptional regulator [Parvibaculum sp.]
MRKPAPSRSNDRNHGQASRWRRTAKSGRTGQAGDHHLFRARPLPALRVPAHVDGRHRARGKGTLYLYFKSKDELFEAICKSLAAQVTESLEEADALDLPLEEKLNALMEAKFGFAYSWVLSSPHAAELIDSSSRLPSAPFEKVTAQFHDAVFELVRKGIESGELDPALVGLSDRDASEALIAAACGAEKAPNEETFRNQLAAIIKLTLRGLRAKT